ncbi:TPA: hypothetical protein ACGAU7_004057, partial [Escherichia coli]
TDLMALFMGAQKMVPPWLLKALLCCLDDSLDVDEIDFTSLELMREARTEDGKYIDILIRHDESRVQQVDFFLSGVFKSS